MFRLKVPAIAAAGAATVFALGGFSSLPGSRALADDGGGGGSGDSSVSSAATTDAGSSAADGGADGGADVGVGADGGAGADAGASAGADSMAVSPSSVAPGGVVTLHLQTSCKSGGKAKASAEVFVDTVTLAPASDGSHGLEGSAFIKSDAVEGSYAISVQCDGRTSSASASITVTTGGSSLLPIAPVPAGGGGTAQLAAGPGSAGTGDGPLLATGAFAAAGLAGLAVYRRRTADRG